MEQVVVSAGEPVAWEITARGTGRTWLTGGWRRSEGAAADGNDVLPLYPSAPVVLPEAPPAELIEQMAKALPAASLDLGLDWDDYTENGQERFRVEARAQYAVLRAWVAGGGETRA